MLSYYQFYTKHKNNLILILFVPLYEDLETIENILLYDCGVDFAEHKTPDGQITIMYIDISNEDILDNKEFNTIMKLDIGFTVRTLGETRRF